MNQNDSADTNDRIIRTSKVGYLPQDTQVGDVEQTALDRILSAVELDKITAKLVKLQQEMGHNDRIVQKRAMKQYDLVHEQFWDLVVIMRLLRRSKSHLHWAFERGCSWA